MGDKGIHFTQLETFLETSTENVSVVILTDKLENEQSVECHEKLLTSLKERFPDHNLIRISKGPGSLSVENDSWIELNPLQWITGLCRTCNFLPNQRSVVLPISHIHQTIQLCLANANKKVCGEFEAAASDVLDVWKYIKSPDFSYHSSNTTGMQLPQNDFKERGEEYKNFLKISGTIDYFDLLQLLKNGLLKQDNCINKLLENTIICIDAIENFSVIERDLFQVVLNNGKLFRASFPASPAEENVSEECELLDISGIGDLDNEIPTKVLECDGHENASSQLIIVNQLSESFKDILNENEKLYEVQSSLPEERKSEIYLELMILSHVRLLLNTRDELALAAVLSMPGREINPKNFNKIKGVAQKKGMPIYQTILSTVMRLQLGGKGYQPDASCPIVLHAKPLSEFINLMDKLQNTIEDQNNERSVCEAVLLTIKNDMSRIKGWTLSKNTLNSVYKRLLLEVNNICTLPFIKKDISTIEEDNGIASQTLSVNKNIRPALKMLLGLCDFSAGKCTELDVADIVGDHLLSQMTPSQGKMKATPFKVPSVLSLFRSPNSPNYPLGGGTSPTSKDMGDYTPLRVRMMKLKGLMPEDQKKLEVMRLKSCCDWAPENLSPISQNSPKSCSKISPVVGPTLKAMAPKNRTSNWKEMIMNLPSSDDQEAIENESPTSPKMPPKKRSKRSLLSDISNLSEEPMIMVQKDAVSTSSSVISQTKNTKKRSRQPKKANSILQTGQRQITSFFKR